MSPIPLPESGRSRLDILTEMALIQQHDLQWQQGKVFSLVFDAGAEVQELLKSAYTMFFSENGLNPTAFPSLRRFETDVVQMSLGLLGASEEGVGNMTTGGTESILMAVKTARDWARQYRPEIQEPEMILPVTAHPAFDKAGAYFDVKPVRVSVDGDFRADIADSAEAFTPNTILLVGSAPSYPQGVLDPIQALGQLAIEHGVLFHVDACVGGFMLPFIRQLGYPVAPFDFSVPGVTSISADLHKYGYAAKGASVILYKNRDIRRHQLFAYTDWPGGIYASPTMTGTRSGGAIAAAWAIMNYLGMQGYLSIADTVMSTAAQIQAGIRKIDGIHILGKPVMSVMALASDETNIYEIGDEMSVHGWHMDRQQFPPSLHLTVNYAHHTVAADFLSDLIKAVEAARRPNLRKMGEALLLRAAGTAVRVLPEDTVSRLTSQASRLLGGEPSPGGRSAAMYGMMGSLPNRGDLNEVVLDLIEQFTEPQKEPGKSKEA